MYRGTIGDFVINHGLPEEFRKSGRVLDKKSLEKLLGEIAQKAPDKYAGSIQHLSDVGRFVAQMTGGNSFGPEHMRLSVAGRQAQIDIKKKVMALFDDKKLSDEDREKRIVEIASDASDKLTQDVYRESLAEHNPLAMQIMSGARGNALNLRSLRAGDLLYVDHRNRPIPFPVLRSYSQGLSPAEFFAASFGARRGVVDVKMGVRNAGFFSKQLVQSMHRLLVTALDRDHEEKDAPLRGLPTKIDDPDNEGALLAMDTGPYKKNTVLTPKIIADLQNSGIERLLVRSPIVGGPPDGGVYGRDAGVREKGGIAPVGDFIGIAAGQALCLAKGTRVRMADGSTKPIEEIEAGDWVMGCSVAGLVTRVQVLARIDNGVRECVVSKFRRGTGRAAGESILELVSTPDHKILSELVVRSGRSHNKYFDPVDIRPVGCVVKPRDYLCAKMPDGFDSTGMLVEPRALLLGLLIGDGSYTGKGKRDWIRFSCYDSSLLTDLAAYLEELGFSLRRMQGGEYDLTDCESKYMKQDESGRLYRHRFIQWLRELGLWGHSSGEKLLPRAVHQWDNRSVADLIAGLLATDGYISASGVVGFSSNSREMLLQVKTLLQLRFGIQTSAVAWSKKKRGDSGEFYATNYRVVLSAARDVKRLASILTVPGVKHARLQELARKERQKSGNYTDRAKLLTQEPAGAVATYDIYVAHPDHLFVLANGLIVSNSEPVVQSGLGSKHKGGVAAANSMSGFDTLNALVQVPKTFKGGAAHAQEDGAVTAIREAPQGGHYVTINGKDHYVGHGYEVKVKPHDQVEAGDVLSEGLPNPSEAVRHKGIGEGSRYFVETFLNAAKDAGMPAHRRNVELLARGLINHVELDDEWGEHVPGDIVSYRRLEHKYQPREGHQVVPPAKAAGQYLEAPVLHYSIGTKVRPSVIKTLGDYGVKNVSVHKDPPPFKTLMIRGMENVAHDSDWMVRFLGSYLKKNFLEGVHRGDVSDEAGTSYVPSLAQTADFGQKPPVRGWTPTGPLPKPPTPAPSIMKQMMEPAPKEELHSMFTQPPAAFKAAADDDPLAGFAVKNPAGTTQSFYDEDDDEDDDTGYPLREITYPCHHGSIAGHVGEDGEELEALVGSDSKGESGVFTVRRIEPWRTKTKVYHHCSPREKDQIMRAYSPILASRPTPCTADELKQVLARFRAK